ncbi:hypothetical protein [Alteriqipengyuania sp.]|uniref:hypothetical protein n=1 Tax=Alteriqipengyuania sp. TaxID=2800692 RepID=UPI003511797F
MTISLQKAVRAFVLFIALWLSAQAAILWLAGEPGLPMIIDGGWIDITLSGLVLAIVTSFGVWLYWASK